jgi:hypothetical protein
LPINRLRPSLLTRPDGDKNSYVTEINILGLAELVGLLGVRISYVAEINILGFENADLYITLYLTNLTLKLVCMNMYGHACTSMLIEEQTELLP